MLIAPNLIQYHGEQSEKEVRGQALQRPLMVVDWQQVWACGISLVNTTAVIIKVQALD